jgi:hypothetical protein
MCFSPNVVYCVGVRMNEELLKYLSPDDRVDFEERAGILQFDAGMDRLAAETMAYKMVMKKHGVTSAKPAQARPAKKPYTKFKSK